MIVRFCGKRRRDFVNGKYVNAFSGFSWRAAIKLDQREAAIPIKYLELLPGVALGP